MILSSAEFYAALERGRGAFVPGARPLLFRGGGCATLELCAGNFIPIVFVTHVVGPMDTFRILVLEDEHLLALSLQEIIFETVEAEFTVIQSVASAEAALAKHDFDFAFLDVHVTDGETYKIASILIDEGVPFAFVSGAAKDRSFPAHLRDVPFLAKPYRPAQITALLHQMV